MPRLTDTQAILLASAAIRPDLTILPAPESLKAEDAALDHALRSLARRGLIAPRPRGEIGAAGGGVDRDQAAADRNWIVTPAGLVAIGAVTKEAMPVSGRMVPECPPTQEAPSQPTKRDHRKKKSAQSQVTRSAESVAPDYSDPMPAEAAATLAPERPKTKKALLIGLLSAEPGADIAALSATLGWQPHTTRAALTGLRKSGHRIETEKAPHGGGQIYRIVEQPLPEGAA